jgi:hypothetical protein
VAAAPKKVKRSPKQAAAAKAWAAAGRASQKSRRAQAVAKTGKPPPRSKAQKTAAQKWQKAGAAATHARAQAAAAGKPYVAPKTAKAPLGTGGLHSLEVCGPAALAEHLLAFTGAWVTDSEIISLAKDSAGGSLGDLLELARSGSFGGRTLAGFRRADPGRAVPGLLYGLETENGYHAVLALPSGVLSWGTAMPWPGQPEEAWYLDWED